MIVVPMDLLSIHWVPLSSLGMVENIVMILLRMPVQECLIR